MKENTTKNTIYLLLKQYDGYVSGEKISEILGITRSAVWKYIRQLRKEGYVIESSTRKGYYLVQNSDRLNEAELSFSLNTKTLGNKIIFLPKTDSTNEEVKRLSTKGYEEGVTVVAEQQTKGKGRLGRIWNSPSDTGLWFSFLLKPDLSPLHIAGITLACGMGVCIAIRKYTSLDAFIKWPNDIIINNKKVCGILTEMSAEADKINFAVVGIGINVNTTSFPSEIQHKATSLYLEKGVFIDRKELFRQVLTEVEKYLNDYAENYGIYVIDEYKKYCATLGRNVCVIRGKQTIQGKAIDIAETGDLVIFTSNNQKININSGEVTVQGIY